MSADIAVTKNSKKATPQIWITTSMVTTVLVFVPIDAANREAEMQLKKLDQENVLPPWGMK